MKYNSIYLLIILVIFYSCGGLNRDNKKGVSAIETDLDYYNLKGKVKELTTNLERNYPDTIDIPTLRQYEMQNNLAYLDKVPLGKYLFDKRGFLRKSFRRFNDSVGYGPIDRQSSSRDINIYNYSKKDYKQKSKHTLFKTYKIPVFNPYNIRINYKLISLEDLEGSVQEKKDYMYYSYIYIYNDKKLQNKIVEYNRKGYITEEEKEPNLFKEKYTYTYDSIGRITAVNYITFENIMHEKDPNFPLGTKYIDHLWIGVYAAAILKYTYKYDEQDRITQVQLFEDEDKVWQEEYYYKNEAERPYKLKRYIDGQGSYDKYLTDYATEYYTKYGDITRAEDYDNEGNLKRTRFYDYTYDKYNNWIECKMYLEGDKERTEQPAIVARREIEYYKDESVEEEND